MQYTSVGLPIRAVVLHKLNNARTVVPLTDGDDALLAEIAGLLDHMADDADTDRATRQGWSQLLTRAVRHDKQFAQSRLGLELLAVAVAYGRSWSADSNRRTRRSSDHHKLVSGTALSANRRPRRRR